MKKKVIDVSYAQVTINWEVVKGHIDGAILRCGYGDNDISQDDAQFTRNADECERLGIPYGVYLYSYADSDAHAKSEAAHILRLIKGRRLSYPVYLDCEQAGTQYYAPKACEIIGNEVERAGYWFGVYANLNWWNNYLTNITRYYKWVAQYNNTCDYNGTYDIWQYTSSGNIPGIIGGADVNECYRDFPGEIAGSVPEPTPVPQPISPQNKAVDVYYRVRTQKYGWLPEVRNLEDCAGFEDSPITDIAMRVSEGRVEYRVHTDGRWLSPVTRYDINDIINGFAGMGKPIDAFMAYFYTPDDIRPYKRVKYRVSPVGQDYYSWQYDDETSNGQDGYAGDMKNRIGKVQMVIE